MINNSTRLLADGTDYHLGGFRAVPPSEFKTQYTRPLVVGTRCHMLGMYVVLESYLSMVADYPRRSGSDWYLGTINNMEARTIKVSLDFLSKDSYTAKIYSDAPDVGKYPNHLVKEVQTVNRTDTISIQLASGGGQVMRIVKH